MHFLIIFLVTFFFLNLPSLVLAHSQTHVVKMTESGFEPQNLTIDENSTVIFLNVDQNDHWPASNNHPTHEIYPEFDPRRAIVPQGSWPFKPKKIGVFKFHDHLYPHFRGTLTVEKEAGTVQEEKEDTSGPKNPVIEWFLHLKELAAQTLAKVNSFIFPQPAQVLGTADFSTLDVQQQTKSLQEMVKTSGVRETWGFFKQTFKGQSGSKGNIHDLAHLVGGLIYEKEGFAGLSICSSEFAFGCYHGFLDKAFEQNLDQLSLAEKSCRDLDSSLSGPFGSCIHGIGHGVASFYQASDLKAALLSCQKLTSGSQFCFDGVFMEFERAAPSSFYSKDNPYSPCDSLEQEFGPIYAFACGRNQTTVLLERFKYSFDDLVGVCLNAKSTEFQKACTDSLGFISVRSNPEPEVIVGECNKFKDLELKSRCAKAAAGELIFQEQPGWGQKAPQVCQSLSLDYQQDCQLYLDNLIKQYGKKD